MKRRLDGIESLRAYAALSVLLFHVVHSGQAALPDAFKFIGTHFGQGVPLFFVVSGFGLAYGYIGKLDDRAGIKGYFIRRFMRIAPLFYVALVFQLFYLWLGYKVTFGVTDILLNGLFVFNLIPPLTDGIVPASWTIGVEMIFYAIFPLLILICTSLWRTALVLVIATLVAVRFSMDTKNVVDLVPSFIYHNFVKNFPFFLCGAFAFHVFRLFELNENSRAAKWVAWISIGVAAAGLLALYSSGELNMYFISRDLRSLLELLYGVPFAFLCLGMAVYPPPILSNRVTRYLGLISFSIYLIHANIVYAMGQAGIYTWLSGVIPDHGVIAFCTSAAVSLVPVVIVASITYRYIERPGIAWGKRLSPSAVADAKTT